MKLPAPAYVCRCCNHQMTLAERTAYGTVCEDCWGTAVSGSDRTAGRPCMQAASRAGAGSHVKLALKSSGE